MLPDLRDLAARISLNRTKRLIARSRIFDRNWYLTEYPESIGGDPVTHYLKLGAHKGFRPHLLFDPAWYREKRGQGQRDPDPLIDYIVYGSLDSIDPSPYFSSAFYRNAAGDLRGLTPLGHFAAFGLRRGLIPAPLFDREWYLANNPDVRRAGFDPFLHFVASGDRDGRSPGPLFDAAWYLMRNANVRDLGTGPLRHYLTRGAREGRDPSCFFDTDFYAGAYASLGVTRETALGFYAEYGRRAWHSTHKTLPPPASTAAYFEDLPWQRLPQESSQGDAQSQILFVCVGGISAQEQAVLKQLLKWLAGRPGLGLFCVTDAVIGPVEGVAVLDMARPEFACLEKSTMLDRILRAMKFLNHRGLVCEAVCSVMPLAAKCGEIELPYHNLAETWPLPAEQQASRLAQLAFCRPPLQTAISVIVPNYNHARFLDERFESILRQRRKPDEIIFLDDGSDDNSLEIARNWQAKSPVPFIIAANEANSGSPVKQWMKGIELAAGGLIWIAESDDSSYPGFLAGLATAFADPDVVLAYCDSEVTGPEGELLSSTYRFYTGTLSKTKWLCGYVEDGAAEIANALAIKNTIPNVSAVLFRRAALVQSMSAAAGFRYCGDWAIYAACLQKGKIAYKPRALNMHRRPEGNLTEAGERDVQAVLEALAIKLSIFAAVPCGASAIWKSLCQTIFEYEIRSRSGGLQRPAFTENAKLAGSIGKLRHLIARQGHKLAEAGKETEDFLRDLALQSASLRQADICGFVSSVFQELKELDARR
ncbi:MAG: glycosyltransferase [Beijerinckiaceae bacterium]|nr:glycosyltransferase [Beijerinckiaceae bacterium]